MQGVHGESSLQHEEDQIAQTARGDCWEEERAWLLLVMLVRLNCGVYGPEAEEDERRLQSGKYLGKPCSGKALEGVFGGRIAVFFGGAFVKLKLCAH